MKSYNLSISYAKEKLEDYEVILMNYGYSELTIKEKKKKIIKFLNMYDDNSPYSIERMYLRHKEISFPLRWFA